jgi:Protein of unknown function (DUF1579)
MNRILAALAVSVVVFAAAASAQQSKKPQAAAKSTPAQASQQAPEVPKPGPEHDLLKKDVGVWDASVELTGPDGQMTTSKGTETVSMIGFWQVAQFKGQMMGQPFEGLGTVTYDPTKKKYVGTWIDSMTPGYSTVESEYDGKSMSGTMEGPDMSGKIVKMREMAEWKDDNTRVFTMYGPKSAEGKEAVTMRITYKRRK